MAYRRSRLKGARSTRKLIRNIPDTMRAEMVHVLSDSGPRITRLMRSRTPRGTGALQAGIKWKVFPKTLKLQVGLLGTKRGRAKLFYGRILDLGRRAQTKKVTRRSSTGTVSSYLMRISAYPAQRFVTGSYKDLRADLTKRLKTVWNRVLRKAAAGAGNE